MNDEAQEKAVFPVFRGVSCCVDVSVKMPISVPIGLSYIYLSDMAISGGSKPRTHVARHATIIYIARCFS
jgi:hypothetical protein